MTIIALATPLLVPVMAAIALLVKCMSRGPVLFRQPRIGLGGSVFECFKFRTMHVGASTGVHERYLAQLIHSNRPMSKLDGDDARIFPLARLLRAAGLDELPQLFNVLRGDMSLVGPRPCTVGEYHAYSRAERARAGVLPGLTGLWQVSGKNDTTFSEMIQLDLRYLRTHCLWLDLGILLCTPVVVLSEAAKAIRRKKGAAGLLDRAQPAPVARLHPTLDPHAGDRQQLHAAQTVRDSGRRPELVARECARGGLRPQR